MNGLLYSHDMHPKPGSSGFVVDSTAFTLFDTCECVRSTEPHIAKPVIDVSLYLRTRSRVDAWPRSYPEVMVLDRSEDESEEDGTFDTSISTLDSFGPGTPPPSPCGSAAKVVLLESPTLLHSSDDFLGISGPIDFDMSSVVESKTKGFREHPLLSLTARQRTRNHIELQGFDVQGTA